MRNRSLIADLGLLYTSIIWGTTFFVVKDLVKYIDPVVLCAYRFLLAALFLYPLLLFKSKKIFANLKEGITLGFLLWIIYVSQTIGLVFTSASNAAFITGLFLVFIPLFLLLIFKKRPSLTQLFVIFISISGLWMLTGGISEINRGDLITILTAIAYALHVLYADKFAKNEIDPYVLCFQQFLFVSIFSFMTALIFNLPLSLNNAVLSHVTKIILFLTIFPTVSAFLIQLFAQKITHPIKVSLIFALEPVFGAIFAWTLGGEEFLFRQAIGGFLIFISLIILGLKLDIEKHLYKLGCFRQNQN